MLWLSVPQADMEVQGCVLYRLPACSWRHWGDAARVSLCHQTPFSMAMALPSLDPYPDLIDPLGVQQLRVLSTFCSSKATSILGLTACFLALRVCFYYKQHSALQGSLCKIMIHLLWKHFFHFFSKIFLNLNQCSGLLAPASRG